MKKIAYMSSLLIISLTFIACGGGGSGSSSNSGTISFPANSTQAEPTVENGEKVESATTTNQSSSVPGLNSINSDTKINLSAIGSNIFKQIQDINKRIDLSPDALNATYRDEEACSNGGKISFVGSSYDSGLYMTYTLSNCKEGSETSNGILHIAYTNNVNGLYTNWLIKYLTDFTYIDSVGTVNISKNSFTQIDVEKVDSSNNILDYKYTTSFQATYGSEYFGLKDCVYYYKTNGLYIDSYQTQGKVYIDNFSSYVDYDTSYDMSQTPFRFYGTSLISGEARYLMSKKGRLKIKVEAYTPVTYVDADGDGVYELSE